jgi:hypothetical protein
MSFLQCSLRGSARSLLWASALWLAAPLWAEETTPIAFVDFTCQSSKSATPAEEQAATQSVKAALLGKYFSSLPPERQTALADKQPVILAAADSYLDNFVIRDRAFDKKTKTLTLTAQADVNHAKITKLIDDAANNGAHQQMVFIFVARRQAEVESKGPKVVTATRQMDSHQTDADAISHNGEASAATGTKTSQAVESVSVETRTADRVVYALDDHFKADIDSRMSEVFVNRGFDVVSAAALVDASGGKFNPDDLQKDFETSSQFSLAHQSLATRTCREAGAPLLAYGTLTILMKRLDPANNRNTLVTVKIDAQIFDCRKPLASKAGSIGAMQVEGVGADASEAEGQAIKLAAEKVASTLADQLHNRGIR